VSGSHSVRDATQDREARGGLSPLAILTGVVVAFGALFLLSAIVGGVLSAIGVEKAASGERRQSRRGWEPGSRWLSPL
jgi:hypothetical protein